MAVRRMTNPFRRGNGGEPAVTRRSLKHTASAGLAALKRLADHLCGWGRNVRKEERQKRGDLRAEATARRSQSLHGTEARKRHMPGQHKPGAGTGGRKVNA